MDFWQARPPQWSQQQRHGAAAAPTFYSAKFRQGLGLGGLASCWRPCFFEDAYHMLMLLSNLILIRIWLTLV